MKKLILMFVFSMLIAFIGCSKDDTLAPQVSTDDQAITEMITSVDSVAEFSDSDESAISDTEEMEWEKAGFDKTTTTVKVFKWGRIVTGVNRNVAVTYIGDSVAVALLTKVLSGNLVIAASYYDSSHHPDTIIRKPFHERLQRKVVFARIGRHDNPRHNWRPVAISLAAGGEVPDTVNKFQILQMDFYTSADTYSVTSPLDTWLRLGAIHDRVPVVRVRDSVIVRLTIHSTDDSVEAAAIRWVGESNGFHERRKMQLVSSVAAGDGFDRVYQMMIRTHLPLGRFVGRFNVVTDVYSWGSFNDDSQPVSNRFWGFPYDVRR